MMEWCRRGNTHQVTMPICEDPIHGCVGLISWQYCCKIQRVAKQTVAFIWAGWRTGAGRSPQKPETNANFQLRRGGACTYAPLGYATADGLVIVSTRWTSALSRDGESGFCCLRTFQWNRCAKLSNHSVTGCSVQTTGSGCGDVATVRMSPFHSCVRFVPSNDTDASLRAFCDSFTYSTTWWTSFPLHLYFNWLFVQASA